MANVHKNITELIGNTPLIELNRMVADRNLNARVLVKVEAFNPGGSAKDRIALAMINAAEKAGKLTPGATIIEPTSGNTGVGLAWIGASRGYRIILTMPETMSEERKTLLRALGAELVLTPGSEGMKGAIARAEELHHEIPGSIIMSQFDNPANPEIHRLTTGPEIWRDTDGNVDIIVAGVGTGGTLSGVSRALKACNPALKAIAVEPATSRVLEGEPAGPHKIQGIGAGFIPANYDPTVIDSIESVTDQEAMDTMRELAAKEGIFAGISSGAALAAALRQAADPANAGKTIVAILPDTGQRYLSML
ncbi:MAG: cysteine synthase A [Muribaculaceae bacterium]|nr:cysteine synthase A [Muribaculaceae bacterium]